MSSKLQLTTSESGHAPLPHRRMLSAEEAANYLNVSLSHLYKLTSSKRIRYSKPSGKKIYFDVDDLDGYLRSNPVLSNDDVNAASTSLLARRREKLNTPSKKRGRREISAA